MPLVDFLLQGSFADSWNKQAKDKGLEAKKIDDIKRAIDEIAVGKLGSVPISYWKLFLFEFHDFLCTDSKKYEDLRRAIRAQSSNSSAAVAATIAVFIASHLGFEAGLIYTSCLALLSILSNVGGNAACRYLQEIMK